MRTYESSQEQEGVGSSPGHHDWSFHRYRYGGDDRTRSPAHGVGADVGVPRTYAHGWTLSRLPSGSRTESDLHPLRLPSVVSPGVAVPSRVTPPRIGDGKRSLQGLYLTGFRPGPVGQGARSRLTRGSPGTEINSQSERRTSDYPVPPRGPNTPSILLPGIDVTTVLLIQFSGVCLEKKLDFQVKED